jgi:uncharacterized protein with PIN domain
MPARESSINVKPFTVRLNFHGDLDFFLSSKAGSGVIERRLTEKTSIKDVVESCGVPHPEIDVILVNDRAVGFNHTVSEDVKVDVFPVGVDPTFRTEQRLQISGISRFVSDGHLGRLTRNLRLLGFDVAYEQKADDSQLLDVMTRDQRALLTCDRHLLMHSVVQHGYCPRSQNADEQTIEVIRRFNLMKLIAPFTRCLRCNAPLEDATKADIIEELEPLTKIYYQEFRRCPGCKQIYWSGSHFTKLQNRLQQIAMHFPPK